MEEEKIKSILGDLESKLKIQIKNPNLFLEALTHSSYLNENKD
jgi:dsRNA-specific ribonuclease